MLRGDRLSDIGFGVLALWGVAFAVDHIVKIPAALQEVEQKVSTVCTPEMLASKRTSIQNEIFAQLDKGISMDTLVQQPEDLERIKAYFCQRYESQHQQDGPGFHVRMPFLGAIGIAGGLVGLGRRRIFR